VHDCIYKSTFPFFVICGAPKLIHVFTNRTPVSSTNKTDRYETKGVGFHYTDNTSDLPTSTLNTKCIWAVLITLHDSATYDDIRKSYMYEWLKHKVLECNFISLKV